VSEHDVSAAFTPCPSTGSWSPGKRAELTRRVRSMLPHNVQIVLFSATFPEEVQNFAQNFAPEANQIFLRKEEVTVEAIKQLHLDVEGEEAKYEALSNLYDCLTIGQSIVFCRVCPGLHCHKSFPIHVTFPLHIGRDALFFFEENTVLSTLRARASSLTLCAAP
jgi:hypothetical protein